VIEATHDPLQRAKGTEVSVTRGLMGHLVVHVGDLREVGAVGVGVTLQITHRLASLFLRPISCRTMWLWYTIAWTVLDKAVCVLLFLSSW